MNDLFGGTLAGLDKLVFISHLALLSAVHHFLLLTVKAAVWEPLRQWILWPPKPISNWLIEEVLVAVMTFAIDGGNVCDRWS